MKGSHPVPSGAASRWTTLARQARTSSPRGHSTRRERERRSSSPTRASITSVSGRISFGRRRLDPAYLGNLVAWDVAFVLDLGDGTEGIVGVVTAYHDVNRRQPPKPSRLPRYRKITETSGIFGPGAIDAVNGTELIHIWLDHLLVLSMLQHPSRTSRWGRLVVVHPAGNTDYADACSLYRALLLDQSTFSSVTVEELLDASVFPARTARAMRKRYLPS